jgi:hypothetical protein
MVPFNYELEVPLTFPNFISLEGWGNFDSLILAYAKKSQQLTTIISLKDNSSVYTFTFESPVRYEYFVRGTYGRREA